MYFSINSCYADDFARRAADENGYRWMFLVEVITGQFALGKKNMVAAPQLPNSTDTLYDSVVDNLEYPTMYIVFKDTAAYPLYILTYKM